MQRRDVHEMDFISLIRQPTRMTAWAASNIQDHGWSGRQKTRKQFARPFTFELAALFVESICLIPGCIVVRNLFAVGTWVRLVHGFGECTTILTISYISAALSAKHHRA
jgi:hypothetical protein